MTVDEWDLVDGRPSIADEASGSDDLASSVLRGDFVRVLHSPSAKSLLTPYAQALAKLNANGQEQSISLSSVGLSLPSAAALPPLDMLYVSVAALHAFIQANWTGPDLDDSLLQTVKLFRAVSPDSFPKRSIDVESADGQDDQHLERAIHGWALDALTFAGEPAYHLCQAPFLLVFAVRTLDAIPSTEVESLELWKLRAFSIHSRILDTPQAPPSELLASLQPVKEYLSLRAVQEQDASKWLKRLARLLVDESLALQRAGRDSDAKEGLVAASKASGLQYQITGAPGKQTKFQREDKMILVLLARSAEQSEQPAQKDELEAAEEDDEVPNTLPGEQNKGWKAKPALNGRSDMPSEYLHNDDTLLERARFTSSVESSKESTDGALSQEEASNPSILDPLDSCILLGLCLNIHQSSPENALTISEMSAFVNRVLSHARNWSVHTMALLLRSRIEADRTRTVQRSALQLQALIDQMPTSDSSVDERLRQVHELELPSKWEMQAELAKRFAALGVLRSALEIFERIELWQEVVQCWGALGRQDKGIEVLYDLLQGRKAEADHVISEKKGGRAVHVGEQLNAARQAKLWCLLGDLEVTKANEHYMQAWTVSGRRSARAARSIGGVAFANNDYPKATLWLRRALRIQPLYARSWFILGCVYIRLDTPKTYIEAARCFRRCVALEDEDAESWNNLASCYLRLAQQSEAVLHEAHLAEQGEAQSDQNAVLQGVQMTDDNEDEGEQSDVDSLHSRDSGVAVTQSDMDTDDADTETEADQSLTRAERERRRRQEALIPALSGGGGSGQGAFDVKLLAHRALAKALRFARDDWRIWNNFMIVSVDCGLMNDAVRALVRVVELRGSEVRAETLLNEDSDSLEKVVDIAVLNRIVDAVTRAPSSEEDALVEEESQGEQNPAPIAGAPTKTVAHHNPNEGHGLLQAVRSLFEDTLLPRISSSSALWRAYARLQFWRGKYRTALNAHLSAWQSGYGAEGNAKVLHEKTDWLDAVEELQELCELLENFGARDVYVRQDEDGTEVDLDVDEVKRIRATEQGSSLQSQEAMANWRFRARSLVRTFIGRTKDAFELEAEWDKLIQLRDSLSNTSSS